MSSIPNSPACPGGRGNAVPRVIVATTALLTFISFWKAAAIVLNEPRFFRLLRRRRSRGLRRQDRSVVHSRHHAFLVRRQPRLRGKL